ncbi:hypothetical protein PENSPDRAFT_690124 [Peniophora sp. CONT]|nr:hypothetical protein PENSPDRAFT_690124 [Peniophora sp. CONT]
MPDDESASGNKRRRVDDGETQSSDNITRHEKLWFDDGNIVLRCSQTDFRVHRSLLALHSEVLRDMFVVASPGEHAEDDVPVVSLSDDPVKIARFLSFFYYHEENLDAIGPLLDLFEISSKYIVPLIREKCLAVLHRAFPPTLSEYQDASELHAKLGVFFEDALRCHTLATAQGLVLLLPAIRLLCLKHYANMAHQEDFDQHRSWPSYLPQSLHIDLLTWSRKLFLLKRVKLDKHIQEFLSDPERDKNYHCARHLAIAFLSYTNEMFQDLGDLRYENDLDIFPEHTFAADLARHQEGICSTCLSQWKEKEKEGRREVWEEVPNCFSLGTWEELRANGG